MDAERAIAEREPLGWRFGLERSERLCALLGFPQRRFASIHVVGTNGKTSVAMMTAALLSATGLRAGAYLSPHLQQWRERVLIAGEPIGPEPFEAAVQRTVQAAEAADRAAGEDGPVTQFELVTAAAFVAFAAARLDVAVIEAGLGGRLDATNVLPSRVTVLTSVGLDHTEWLGERLAEIAAEKLAVVKDHSTLVVGELPSEADEVAVRIAGERSAALSRAPREPPAELAALVPPGYQRRNLALAVTAAEALAGRRERGSVAAERLAVPGRAQPIGGDPPRIVDAAHNPDGARALAALLPELGGGRPIVACVATLEDKDAEGIVAALSPALEAVVCTSIDEATIAGSGRPMGRSRDPEALAALFRAHGLAADAIGDASAAWRRAKALARERGAVALVTGSHYLLSELAQPGGISGRAKLGRYG